MGNKFTERTAESLLNLTNAIGAAVTSTPNVYGITNAELSSLTNARSGLTDAIAAQAAAQATEKSATTAKGEKKAATVAVLNAIAATVYAQPGLTDSQITALGLAPRRKGSVQAKAATRVTGLQAIPSVEGSVRLTWARGDNRYGGTTFLIEASEDGVAWAFVKSTSRVSETLTGYPAGAAAWFRVTAATSTTTALPSSPVSIYAPAAAPVSLRLAA